MAQLDDTLVMRAFPEFSFQSGPLAPSGYKTVYRVTAADGALLALKVIKDSAKPDGAEPDPEAQRFAREIEVMASMQHPSIISIHTAPQTRQIGATQHWWYTERYCPGGTLAMRLTNGALGPGDTRRLVQEILSALDYMWTDHQTIHRDIKPDNIGILENGRAVLLDLGIAVDLRLERITSTLAPSPLSMPWAAPEQLTMVRAQIDTRTDMFQLGVVAHQALTGEHPFYEGLSYVSDPIGLMEAFDPARMKSASGDTSLINVISRCLRVSQNARPRNPRAGLKLLGAPS